MYEIELAKQQLEIELAKQQHEIEMAKLAQQEKDTDVELKCIKSKHLV